MPFVDYTEIPPTRGSAEADRAATQTVLRRAKREGWTRADTIDVLAALGLVDYPAGGCYDSVGRRRDTQGEAS